MPSPARAGRREWIGLAVLALPCVVYAMDLTVLNLALPALSEDLQPSGAQLLWIVDIYGFMVAGLLITMGTLGDRTGRRRLLLIGAAAFGLASIFVAFSTSAEMLIAARALLGVAGATLAPSTLSLIRNMFEDLEEIRAPVLVLSGDRDELIPLDLSVSLFRALPNAELAICPWLSHDGPSRARPRPRDPDPRLCLPACRVLSIDKRERMR